VDGEFILPVILDLVEIEDIPVSPHGVTEFTQELNNLLKVELVPKHEREVGRYTAP
jgi:hypothetical protein